MISLLLLASNSDLIDAGVNVGLPYNGTAPHLEAFETSTPLPVDTLSFTASVINKKVILQWLFTNEKNNKGWAVERLSPLSDKWETIGFVDGNVGNGNYLYRLKQVDLDGNSRCGAVQSVSLSALANPFS